jgi:hypothetical protein
MRDSDERIKKLEREVELLREWVELKERLSELDRRRQHPVPYPVYVPQQPFHPTWPRDTFYCYSATAGRTYVYNGDVIGRS